MNIFEYMGWKTTLPIGNGERQECEICYRLHPLNGNDMVEAINKMRERGDYDEFEKYVLAIWLKDKDKISFGLWLFGSTETFFRLMGECLDKHIIGGK